MSPRRQPRHGIALISRSQTAALLFSEYICLVSFEDLTGKHPWIVVYDAHTTLKKSHLSGSMTDHTTGHYEFPLVIQCSWTGTRVSINLQIHAQPGILMFHLDSSSLSYRLCLFCIRMTSQPFLTATMLTKNSSIILWEFCLRHPEVRDVCDIGQMLFWNQKWAWWFTAVMFVLNNTFIQVSKIPSNSILSINTHRVCMFLLEPSTSTP